MTVLGSLQLTSFVEVVTTRGKFGYELSISENAPLGGGAKVPSPRRDSVKEFR